MTYPNEGDRRMQWLRLARRWAGGLFLLMAAGAQADTSASASLAGQVNEQIVRKELVEQGKAFLKRFGTGTDTPRNDEPPACRAALEDAIATFVSGAVEQISDGINDPAFQASFDAQIAATYSVRELQAFLDRRDNDSLATIMADVLAAPALRAAQDAHMQALLEQTLDPAQPAAVAVIQAKETCERMRLQSP